DQRADVGVQRQLGDRDAGGGERHQQQPGLGASGVVAAEGVERARRLPRRVGGERVEPGFEPAVHVGGGGRDGRGVSPSGGTGVRGAGGTAHVAGTATRPRWWLATASKARCSCASGNRRDTCGSSRPPAANACSAAISAGAKPVAYGPAWTSARASAGTSAPCG